MNDFSDISPVALSANQLGRISKRDVLPTQVKSRFLPQDILKNSSVSTGTFSINDNVIITITARVYSTLSEDIRLGVIPYMVAFYDADSLGSINPGTNQIPFDTTTGDWDLYGPVAMPDYTVSGKRYFTNSAGNDIYFATNGNNVVIKTAIANNTGGAETVTYLIQSRTIQSRGGGSE